MSLSDAVVEDGQLLIPVKGYQRSWEEFYLMLGTSYRACEERHKAIFLSLVNRQ